MKFTLHGSSMVQWYMVAQWEPCSCSCHCLVNCSSYDRASNKVFFLRFQFLRDKILFVFILEVFEKQSRFPLVVEKKENSRNMLWCQGQDLSKGNETFAKIFWRKFDTKLIISLSHKELVKKKKEMEVWGFVTGKPCLPSIKS